MKVYRARRIPNESARLIARFLGINRYLLLSTAAESLEHNFRVSL